MIFYIHVECRLLTLVTLDTGWQLSVNSTQLTSAVHTIDGVKSLVRRVWDKSDLDKMCNASDLSDLVTLW